MRRRDLLAGVAGAGTFGLAGCTGTGEGDGRGDDGARPTVGETVSLDGLLFSPVRASVTPGEAVEWTNAESVGHDVTADRFTEQAADWTFAESLSGGESTTYTFETAGVYEYQCTVHGADAMCGAVLVGDVSLPEGALPCESGAGAGAGDGGYY